MGKSNLLDAIYYLSFTKSFGRLPDSMLIKYGEEYGIANGCYERHGVRKKLMQAYARVPANRSGEAVKNTNV